MTLTGTNFGDPGLSGTSMAPFVHLSIFSGSYTYMNTETTTGFSTDSVTYVSATRTFEAVFTVPAGAGSYAARMTLKDSTCTSNCVINSNASTANVVVFIPPVITKIIGYTDGAGVDHLHPTNAPATTNATGGTGSWITIMGTGFPNFTIAEAVALQLEVKFSYGSFTDNCTTPFIENNTDLVCAMSPGAGKGYVPSFFMNGAAWYVDNTVGATFDYAAPTITSATSVSYWGNALASAPVITIKGTNFSPGRGNGTTFIPVGYGTGSYVKVFFYDNTLSTPLGETACTSVTVPDHETITCSTPNLTDLLDTNDYEVKLKVYVGPEPAVGDATDYKQTVEFDYTFAAPKLSDILQSPSIFGGTMYIEGTNLGPTVAENGGVNTITSVKLNGQVLASLSELGNPAVSDETINGITKRVVALQLPPYPAGRLFTGAEITFLMGGIWAEIGVATTCPTSPCPKVYSDGPQIAGATPISTQGGFTVIYGTGLMPPAWDPQQLAVTVTVSGVACEEPGGGVYNTKGLTLAEAQAIYPGVPASWPTYVKCSLPKGTGKTPVATPAGDGTGDIFMEVLTKASVNLPGYSGFSYSIPEITSVLDSTGGAVLKPGEMITITGQNFGDDLSLISVRFKRVGATFTDASDVVLSTSHTELTCTLPSSNETYGNTVDMQVTVDGLNSLYFRLQIEPPTVTSVSTITYAGGQVTMVGTNFGPDCDLTGLGIPCSVVTLVGFGANSVACLQPIVTDLDTDGNGDQLECTLPPAQTTFPQAGGQNQAYAPCTSAVACPDLDPSLSMAVVVNIGGQTSTPVNVSFATPAVTKITGDFGGELSATSTTIPSATTGQNITLEGTGFGTQTEGLYLAFTHADGTTFTVDTATAVTEMTDTKMVITSPVGYGKSLVATTKLFHFTPDLSVVNADGTPTSPWVFSFGPPAVAPAVDQISSTSPNAINGTVTVVGKGFGRVARATTTYSLTGTVFGSGDKIEITVGTTTVTYTSGSSDIVAGQPVQTLVRYAQGFIGAIAPVPQVANRITATQTCPLAGCLNPTDVEILVVHDKAETPTVTVTGVNPSVNLAVTPSAPVEDPVQTSLQVVLHKLRALSSDSTVLQAPDIRPCTSANALTPDGVNVASPYELLTCTIASGTTGGEWDVYVGAGSPNPANGPCTLTVDTSTPSAATYTFAGSDCQVTGHETSTGTPVLDATSTDGQGVWGFLGPSVSTVNFCTQPDSQCYTVSYPSGIPIIQPGDVAASGAYAASKNKLFVRGQNFGIQNELLYGDANLKLVNEVAVWIVGPGDGTCTKTDAVTNVTRTLPGTECANAAIHVIDPATNATAIECEVPSGVGKDLKVYVAASGQLPTMLTVDADQNGILDVDDTPRVTFKSARITAVTEGDTNGSEVVFSSISDSPLGLREFMSDPDVDDPTCYNAYFQSTSVQLVYSVASRAAYATYDFDANPANGLESSLCASTAVFKDAADGNLIKLKCIAPEGTGRGHSFRIKIRGAEQGNATNSVRIAYSFAPPVITSITQPKAIGDTVTISGRNLGRGAMPASALVFKRTETSRTAARALPGTWCANVTASANPTDTVNGTGAHYELTCTIPANIGYEYHVLLDIDGLESGATGDRQLTFITPSISTTSVLITAPDGTGYASRPLDGNPIGETTVSIKGLNFGVPTVISSPDPVNDPWGGVNVVFSTDVALTPNGGTKNSNVTFVAPVESVVLTRPRDDSEEYLIIARLPVGAGTNVHLFINAGGQWSQASTRAVINFPPPIVYATNIISTDAGVDTRNGGQKNRLTIIGDHFGPTRVAVTQVLVGAYNCANPAVTVEAKQIECDMPAGSGEQLPLDISIMGGRNEPGGPTARFQCPSVTAVRTLGLGTLPASTTCDMYGVCQPGRTGQQIVVEGYNFGYFMNPHKVKVKFLKPGSTDQNLTYWTVSGADLDVSFDPTVPQPTTNGLYRLLVIVPIGYGGLLPVAVEVDGQDNLGMCATPTPVATVTQGTKFSFPKAVVTRVDAMKTSGELVTIHGQNFGPEGGVDLEVMIESYRQHQYYCTEPYVMASYLNTRIVCSMQPGTGKSNNLVIKRGPASNPAQRVNSDAWPHLDYLPPVISSILCYRPQPLLAFRPDKSSPPTVQCYAGDWVYVRGENFGMAPSETQVQIYDPNVVDPATMMNKVTGVARVPDSCLISTGTDNCDHNLITFRMPAGSGKRQSVQVQTLGASTFYRAFANESAFNAQPVYFEYFPPNVTSVTTPVDTAGGLIQVQGTYFGTLGNVVRVEVGTQVCDPLSPGADVVVTAVNGSTGDGEMIECLLPPGVGELLDVKVWTNYGVSVAQQYGTLSQGFSRSAPVVTGGGIVDPVTNAPTSVGKVVVGKDAEVVEFRGTNFGNDVTQIIVYLGSEANAPVCGSVTLVTDHTVLRCTVPTDKGLTKKVVVKVGNQRSIPPPDGSDPMVFTFYREGCRTATSSNYDEFATHDDGSCFLTGCATPGKDNYIPPSQGVVRDTTPSMCIDPPTKMDLRLSTPFNEFKANQASIVANTQRELAQASGISTDRYVFVGASAGSTVMNWNVINISPLAAVQTGQPLGSTAVAALAAAINSGALVLSAGTVLAFSANGAGLGDSGISPIVTRAGNAEVSVWNYVALAFGIVLVIALLFSIRPIMKYCKRRREAKRAARVVPLDGSAAVAAEDGGGLNPLAMTQVMDEMKAKNALPAPPPRSGAPLAHPMYSASARGGQKLPGLPARGTEGRLGAATAQGGVGGRPVRPNMRPPVGKVVPNPYSAYASTYAQDNLPRL